VCAVLVEHDVDLNLGNSLGTAPLATASRYGHTEVVEWLLAAPSVRVDATDDAGFTALHEVRSVFAFECVHMCVCVHRCMGAVDIRIKGFVIFVICVG